MDKHIHQNHKLDYVIICIILFTDISLCYIFKYIYHKIRNLRNWLIFHNYIFVTAN